MSEKFPQLATERLDLIEITKIHLFDFFILFSDERVARYYQIIPFKEVKEAQVYLDLFEFRMKRQTGIRWGIALKGRTNIIGTIGFNSFQRNQTGNLAYDLQFDFWNRGFATEAARAVLNYGFDHLEIIRVEADVMIGNTGSDRVLEKLGFTYEGVVLKRMYWNGKYYDKKVFSLPKEDFNRSREERDSGNILREPLPEY
jgi:ribosomal-protein-alanine N-acetyltransferase